MHEAIKRLLEAAKLDIDRMERLEGGTSNDTYLISNALVYREKKESDPRFYSPLYEERALVAAFQAQVAPPVLFFDEKTGDSVTAYVPGGERFPERGAKKEDLFRAIAAMKSLHKAEASLPPFDAVKRLSFYRDEAGARGLFAGEEETASLFESYLGKDRQVLSHNDLVGSNILFFQGKALLIDFEFAGYNDPYFDLASLLGENGIEDDELIDEALFEMFSFGGNRSKLDAFLAFEDVLWGYWALYREKMTSDPLFHQIFLEKKASYERRPLLKSQA